MDLQALSQFQSSKNSLTNKTREDANEFESKLSDLKDKFKSEVKEPLDIVGGAMAGDFTKDIAKKGAVAGLKKLGLSDERADFLGDLKLSDFLKSPKKTIQQFVGTETKGTPKAPIRTTAEPPPTSEPPTVEPPRITSSLNNLDEDMADNVNKLETRQSSLLDKLRQATQPEEEGITPVKVPKTVDSNSISPIKEDLANPTSPEDELKAFQNKTKTKLTAEADEDEDPAGSLIGKMFKTMASTDAEGGGLEDIGGDIVSLVAGIGVLFGGIEAHKRKLPNAPSIPRVIPTYQLGVQ